MNTPVDNYIGGTQYLENLVNKSTINNFTLMFVWLVVFHNVAILSKSLVNTYL